MNVLKYRKFVLVKWIDASWWLTGVLKNTHLQMEEKLLDIGWNMDSTHLEPVSVMVPPLPEQTQCCMSPANALVSVLAAWE